MRAKENKNNKSLSRKRRMKYIWIISNKLSSLAHCQCFAKCSIKWTVLYALLSIFQLVFHVTTLLFLLRSANSSTSLNCGLGLFLYFFSPSLHEELARNWSDRASCVETVCLSATGKLIKHTLHFKMWTTMLSHLFQKMERDIIILWFVARQLMQNY